MNRPASSSSAAAAIPDKPLDLHSVPGETRAETEWYDSLRKDQKIGFNQRGKSPTEDGAKWIPVTEWWPIRLVQERHDYVMAAGKTLTKALRHPGEWWTPPLAADNSLSSTTAINMLILRSKVARDTPPRDLYTFCKLFKKDKDRPRYHLLVRDPSREEMFIPEVNPGVINEGRCWKPEIIPFMIEDAGPHHSMTWGKTFFCGSAVRKGMARSRAQLKNQEGFLSRKMCAFGRRWCAKGVIL